MGEASEFDVALNDFARANLKAYATLHPSMLWMLGQGARNHAQKSGVVTLETLSYKTRNPAVVKHTTKLNKFLIQIAGFAENET